MIETETLPTAGLWPPRPGGAGPDGARRPPASVRLLEWDAAEEISPEWEELARASVDPNPFLEPAFALSLALHSPPERRPRFLTVREDGRLIGLFALDRSGSSSWQSPLVALSAPLLRRGATIAALDGALAWLRRETPSWPGLFYARMDGRSQTCRAILSHALRNGLAMQEFDRSSRAALRRSDAGLMREVAGKRAKELRRQLRRLQEQGDISFTSATNVPAVRSAAEEFLALEASGWKGRRGTALLCNPVQATFARTASRRLAGLSKCSIEALRLDGKPIAMGVVIRSQNHAAFWKIAHDEAYAAYSPGAQLAFGLARALAQDPAIDLVDSCAVPDHPMIDHLWLDRREIVDILVGGGDASAFARAVQLERARRGIRRVAKSAFLTLTGRRAS